MSTPGGCRPQSLHAELGQIVTGQRRAGNGRRADPVLAPGPVHPGHRRGRLILRRAEQPAPARCCATGSSWPAMPRPRTGAADPDAADPRGQAAGRAVRSGRRCSRRCRQLRARPGGAARGRRCYGVNTGMGALAGVRLTEAAAARPPAQPAAGPGHRRPALAGRRRRAGAHRGPAAHVPVRRRRRVRRAVPAAGRRPRPRHRPGGAAHRGAGSAGEIIPLAHAFGPAGRDRPGARARAAATGPAAPGAARPRAREFSLGPKEGIALLAGVPGATALALCAAATPPRWRR